MKNKNKEWWYAVIRFWRVSISFWSLLLIICLACLFIFRCQIWAWVSDTNNSNVVSAFVGALAAGLIAIFITKWQIRKQSKIQREAIRDEQLFNAKNKFTEEFLDAYLSLFIEINKLINSQKLKISQLREFLEKKTIGGVSFDCDQVINLIIENRGCSGNVIDSNTIKVAVVKIITLLNLYRYISVDIIKAISINFSSAYSEENINKIIIKWNVIENKIIAQKSIEGITHLLNDYDKELGVVFKDFQLYDSYFTKTIRPFQIETLNHINPKDTADRINQQAWHWLEIQNSSKCIEIATKSLKYRKSHEAYQLIGKAYLAEGEYESALKFLNKALRLEPTNFVSLDKKAACYIGLRKYQMAIDTYVKLIDLNVEGYISVPNLIELFIINNDIDNARQYLRLGKEVLPNNTFSLILLEIIIEGLESSVLDKEEAIAKLKNTVDYEISTWSFNELRNWLADIKKSKHIDAATKAGILELILYIETEKNNGKAK